MPLFGIRTVPLWTCCGLGPCPCYPRGKRQPHTPTCGLNSSPSYTLLIQNMAGDKCTQGAEPGLDGTGRHWARPRTQRGMGRLVAGRKAGNGTDVSPHSPYDSNLFGFRLKRCQGQIGYAILNRTDKPASIFTFFEKSEKCI